MSVKKITMYIVVAVLCLIFKVEAQNNNSVDVSFRGLQIGQQVPDVSINGLQGYKDASGKLMGAAKLSDFKGKLLILDFWATWCSPCVAMIPKMDSLQKAFGGKVQFLSVTYQSAKEVLPFLEQFEKSQGRRFDLPVLTSDTQLGRLFPYVYLPHYVWINASGTVKAITESYDVNRENIQQILSSGHISAKLKVDVPVVFDKSKPLFFGDSLVKANVLKQSTFSSYIEGVGAGYSKSKYAIGNHQVERILARNSTIKELYHYAYQKDYKEIVFEVADTARINFRFKMAADYKDWRRNGNAFCYELINGNFLTNSSNGIMQQELDAFFTQYTARIEKRKVKCLALVRTSDALEIPNAKGKSTADFNGFGAEMTNCPLTVFIARMQYFLQGHPLPLLDDTGYKRFVDLSIKANLASVKELNVALEKYQLKFVEKEAYLDMLIIRDKNQVVQSKL